MLITIIEDVEDMRMLCEKHSMLPEEVAVYAAEEVPAEEARKLLIYFQQIALHYQSSLNAAFN